VKDYDFTSMPDALCDRCFTLWEDDPTTPVSEFCDRCKRKLLEMIFEPEDLP
jgi:hypothetical protein